MDVTRDGKWWMITVPELNGYIGADGAINLSTVTQARRISEVPSQAKDFICTVTDMAPSEVDLHITIYVDDIDVTDRANKLAAERQTAERHAAAAAAEAKSLARELAARGVPVRDVGEVLGVSFQRAQQLISA
ncbi:HicB family toxin-antitoxin system [Mycobacterium botniense]|uniref:HicB family toxin-antitoxin system n=1 Tax=Mycobacterium botniense TaxID=84962 RepID=UPI001FEB3094|nr:HicB family toxin-antitoxin system [Mycobacterium botniense]